jgi:hypothetical protein
MSISAEVNVSQQELVDASSENVKYSTPNKKAGD